MEEADAVVADVEASRDGVIERETIVDYVNKLLPDEHALSSLDSVLQSLQVRIQMLEGESLAIVRQRALAGGRRGQAARDAVRSGANHVALASQSIESLQERIVLLSQRAEEYDAFVLENMNELQRLVRGKRNVDLRLEALQHWRGLTSAVQSLAILAPKGVSPELVPLVRSAIRHVEFFDKHRAHPRLAALFRQWDDAVGMLRKDIVAALQKYRDNDFSHADDALKDACHLADLLPDLRQQVAEDICRHYGDAYSEAFPRETAQVADVRRRYDMIRKYLDQCASAYGDVVSDNWQLPRRVALELCAETRDHLSRFFDAQFDSVDASEFVEALQLTRTFEDQLCEFFVEDAESFHLAISRCFDPYVGLYVAHVSRAMGEMVQSAASLVEGLTHDLSEESILSICALSTQLQSRMKTFLDRSSVFVKNKVKVDVLRACLQEFRKFAETLQAAINACPPSAATGQGRAVGAIANAASDCAEFLPEISQMFLEAIGAEHEPTDLEQDSLVDLFRAVAADAVSRVAQTLDLEMDPALTTVRYAICKGAADRTRGTKSGELAAKAAKAAAEALEALGAPIPEGPEALDASNAMCEIEELHIQTVPDIAEQLSPSCRAALLESFARYQLDRFGKHVFECAGIDNVALDELAHVVDRMAKLVQRLPSLCSQALSIPGYSRSVSDTTQRIKVLLQVATVADDRLAQTLLDRVPTADVVDMHRVMNVKGVHAAQRSSLNALFGKLVRRHRALASADAAASSMADGGAGGGIEGDGDDGVAVDAGDEHGGEAEMVPEKWRLEGQDLSLASYEALLLSTILQPELDISIPLRDAIKNTIRVHLGLSNRMHARLVFHLKQCEEENPHKARWQPFATFRLALVQYGDLELFQDKDALQEWMTRQLRLVMTSIFFMVRQSKLEYYTVPEMKLPIPVADLLDSLDRYGAQFLEQTFGNENLEAAASTLSQIEKYLLAVCAQLSVPRVDKHAPKFLLPFPAPLGLDIYETLVTTCFDEEEEGAIVSNSEYVFALLRHTWPHLGVTEPLHMLAVARCYFAQFERFYNFSLLPALQEVLETGPALTAAQVGDQESALGRYATTVLEPMATMLCGMLEDYRMSFATNPEDLQAVLRCYVAAKRQLDPGVGAGAGGEGAPKDRRVELDVTNMILSSVRRQYKRLTSKFSKPYTTGTIRQIAEGVREEMEVDAQYYSEQLGEFHGHPFRASSMELARRLHEDARPVMTSLSGNLESEGVAALVCMEEIKARMLELQVEVPTDLLAFLGPCLLQWTKAQTLRFDEYLERSIANETWEALSESVLVSPSAVDLFAMFHQTLSFVAGIPSPLARGSAKTLLTKISMLVADYCGEVIERLPSFVPTDEMMQQALRMVTGTGNNLFNKMRGGGGDDDDDEPLLHAEAVTKTTLRSVCIRLNNVTFAMDKLAEMCQDVQSAEIKDLLITTIQDAKQKVPLIADAIAERAVLGELAEAARFVYVPVPSEESNMDLVTEALEPILVELKETVDDAVFPQVVTAIWNKFVVCYLNLLRGNGWTVYAIDNPTHCPAVTGNARRLLAHDVTKVLASDVENFCEFFMARDHTGAPQGLGEEDAEYAQRKIDAFLRIVMGATSESLKTRYEKGTSDKDDDPQPWTVTKRAILEVLRSRTDKTAQKFARGQRGVREGVA